MTPSAVVLFFKRWLFGFLGLTLLAVAVLGIYLPGIPTTGPLLLSMYLCSKSCPKFQEYVSQSRLLKPYAGYLDGSRPFTRRMRWYATGCMWTSITLSCLLLSLAGRSAWLPVGGCLMGGFIGTIVIFRFRRGQTANG